MIKYHGENKVTADDDDEGIAEVNFGKADMGKYDFLMDMSKQEDEYLRIGLKLKKTNLTSDQKKALEEEQEKCSDKFDELKEKYNEFINRAKDGEDVD